MIDQQKEGLKAHEQAKQAQNHAQHHLATISENKSNYQQENCILTEQWLKKWKHKKNWVKATIASYMPEYMKVIGPMPTLHL